MNLASTPEADFTVPSGDELNRLDGQIRLVASESVRNHFRTFTQQVGRFNARLGITRLEISATGTSDEPARNKARALEQRMELGRVADEMRATYRDLEAAIRKDVQS